MYDRRSLDGLQSDIRTLSKAWFKHDAHDSVTQFVCLLPLAYFRFDAHNRYADSTSHRMETLFRLFVLKECHGWDHETALVEYVGQHPHLCEQLDMETVPDQSTLWRSWHKRFTADLRQTVETTARTILIKAQNAGVAVPREPERKLRHHDNESENEGSPDDKTILKQAAEITNHVNRVVFPAFSLYRGDGCVIHENAYWELQTHLGLRENLAANEGARSFIHEFAPRVETGDLNAYDILTQFINSMNT